MLSTNVDLMQLCRLCLIKNGGKVPILADDNTERIVKINTCLPVNVSRDDCLPKTICDGCSVRLDLHYQFWTMSLNTQNELMMLWNQINLKPNVDITEEAIVQIKNESFEVKEEVIEAHEQTTVDLEDVIIITESCIENDYDVDGRKVNLEASEVDSPSRTILQNPGSISSSFQMKKCNKRRAAIKAAKIIRNAAEDNEDVDNSDVDEDFIIPTNNDTESEDPLGNLDFVPVGVKETTEVCSNMGIEIKMMESDKVLKSKRICPNLQSLVDQTTKEELVAKLRNYGLRRQSNLTDILKCTICENKCADLNRPKCKHADHKPHKCDICKFKCSYASHLKLHMRKHTAEKPYECNICEYKCSELSALQRHMLKHASEKPFICNICGFKSSRSSGLRSHMRIHTGEKPYECNICDYKCSDPHALRYHMHTHTGEKPYKCNVCEFKCSQLSNLKIHMRKHTGERPYKCNVCNFKCSQSSNLQYHMRIHTGEKPYKCNTCQYACSHPSNMQCHMRTHIGDERLKCHEGCFQNINVARLIRLIHSYSKLT